MLHSAKLRIVIAALLAAGMLGYYFVLLAPDLRAARTAMGYTGGSTNYSDLYMLWRGSRSFLFEHQDPYRPEITRDIQTAIYGHALQNDYGAFVYPAPAAILFAPFAAMPFAWAQCSFLFLIMAATVQSLRWWSAALRSGLQGTDMIAAALLLVTAYPALDGFSLQQPGLLIAALVAAAMMCVARERFTMAGVLLAFASLKPQYVVLLLAVLGLWVIGDWVHRRRVALSFMATASLLVAVATIHMPRWIPVWLTAIREYRQYATPSLVEVLLGPVVGRVVTVALVLGIVALGARTRRESTHSPLFALTSALALVATVLIMPNGACAYVEVLLLPAVLLVGSYARQGAFASPARRMMLFIGAFSFFWPWLAGSAWWLVTLLGGRIASGRGVSLPVQTTAALPFTLLALLGLVAYDALSARRARAEVANLELTAASHL